MIPRTSPDGGGLWLSKKPLNAAIGQLLALYRPGGRQGDSKQNENEKCTNFDGNFDCHRDAAVLYRAHCLIEEVHGFHESN